jgi:spore germination cell wall hydrolase CwlJ-like protein
MFTALICEARLWPILWRRRLSWYWHSGARSQLPFVLLIAALLAAVAGAIYFASIDGIRAEPARIEAMQYAEARAQRRVDELQCLAQNIYFEARGEPLAGQFAVAEVTLNRTRALHFPHTVCAVVHERRWDAARRRHVADFSWTELGALSPEDGAAWKQAMTVASAVYDDEHPSLVPGALFYHAVSVRPEWAHSHRPVATIGNHIFYR